MLLTLATIIVVLIAFFFYIKWASGYYASLDTLTLDQETNQSITPSEKRKSWKYTILPPRSVADSYGVINYNYKYQMMKLTM